MLFLISILVEKLRVEMFLREKGVAVGRKRPSGGFLKVVPSLASNITAILAICVENVLNKNKEAPVSGSLLRCISILITFDTVPVVEHVSSDLLEKQSCPSHRDKERL